LLKAHTLSLTSSPTPFNPRSLAPSPLVGKGGG
jgi:hypothetical protein